MKSSLKISALAAAVLLTVGSGANAVVTNFSTDVATSIDNGLAWQDANNAYSGGAGDATGLSLLALLEKRQGNDPNALSQGYAAASAADKTRMDSAVAWILANHVAAAQYAYRDGADMMALSVYLLTGGPNPGVPAAINTIFDRTIANQGTISQWRRSTRCYWRHLRQPMDCPGLFNHPVGRGGPRGSAQCLFLRGPCRRCQAGSAEYRGHRRPRTPTSPTASPARSLLRGRDPDRRRSAAMAITSGNVQLPPTDRLRDLDSTRRRGHAERPQRSGLPGVAAQPLPLHEHGGLRPRTVGRPTGTTCGVPPRPTPSSRIPAPRRSLPRNLTPAKIGILPPGDAPAFAAREVHLDCAVPSRACRCSVPALPAITAIPLSQNGFTSTTRTRSSAHQVRHRTVRRLPTVRAGLEWGYNSDTVAYALLVLAAFDRRRLLG
jgi:hypothetical protein